MCWPAPAESISDPEYAIETDRLKGTAILGSRLVTMIESWSWGWMMIPWFSFMSMDWLSRVSCK